MRIIKYSTEHLICYEQYDEKNQKYYGIYEIGNNEPVALYVDKTSIQLNDQIPTDVESYKYFNELSEIVATLMDLELAGSLQ